jgi:hypothetical protein
MVEELNSIEIDGKKFYYRTMWKDWEEYGRHPTTQFFQDYEMVPKRKRKSFFSFDTVYELSPNILFTIEEDAEDPRKTKEWWKEKISEQLKFLDRKREIESGGLI